MGKDWHSEQVPVPSQARDLWLDHSETTRRQCQQMNVQMPELLKGALTGKSLTGCCCGCFANGCDCCSVAGAAARRCVNFSGSVPGLPSSNEFKLPVGVDRETF